MRAANRLRTADCRHREIRLRRQPRPGDPVTADSRSDPVVRDDDGPEADGDAGQRDTALARRNRRFDSSQPRTKTARRCRAWPGFRRSTGSAAERRLAPAS